MEKFRSNFVTPADAKPGIPIEKPREREIPLIPNPIYIPKPEQIPTPTEIPNTPRKPIEKPIPVPA